eukprot:CAMPEP_0170199262 /NCGR_PEP_ID=MMETSP0040_2-20121228/69240_1 /TAXON_ID=641309 /ORGANISM="Lotharella oceanica, Strain CCMP622" /LENGTH=209 /DNA_ID=CAMNT_0010449365 /DNA_START=45 /DNA_END=674 /DNA_ORIENTATION=+
MAPRSTQSRPPCRKSMSWCPLKALGTRLTRDCSKSRPWKTRIDCRLAAERRRCETPKAFDDDSDISSDSEELEAYFENLEMKAQSAGCMLPVNFTGEYKDRVRCFRPIPLPLRTSMASPMSTTINFTGEPKDPELYPRPIPLVISPSVLSPEKISTKSRVCGRNEKQSCIGYEHSVESRSNAERSSPSVNEASKKFPTSAKIKLELRWE